MSKEYYKRNLPHIQPEGATFFVTFRLFSSIPYSLMHKLKQKHELKKADINTSKAWNKKALLSTEKHRYFEEADNLLDRIKEGPIHLLNPSIAKILADELYEFDSNYYDLICFTIMSNHVHILIDTSIQVHENRNDEYIQLDQIMKKIKGRSAMKSNKALGRSGKFWEQENFDTYIRNDKHLNNVISYILMNPVNARLVKNWEDWKFTYFKYKK